MPAAETVSTAVVAETTGLAVRLIRRDVAPAGTVPVAAGITAVFELATVTGIPPAGAGLFG